MALRAAARDESRGRFGGADGHVCAGPPGPSVFACVERADVAVGRRPGGPPHLRGRIFDATLERAVARAYVEGFAEAGAGLRICSRKPLEKSLREQQAPIRANRMSRESAVR